MKMKNIIFIIFTLVIGVTEALGQTRELTGGTIYTVTPAEGENTVTLNETLVIPTTGGPVTIYIPAGVTLDITGANAGDGGTGQDGTPSVTNAAGGSGGTAAMPAISVPLGATLIITGEGTLIAKGGNGGAGGNGGNGESGKANAVNDFAGAGGGGGGGGGGAAAAIGGAGGNGGAGANGAKYTEDALFGSTYGVSGDLGNAGSNGIAMGNVYIVGNVHVSTQGGQQSQTNTYYSRNYGLKGNFGTTEKKGSYYYHSGGYGYGGFDGSTPTYSIGGGGNGGRGGNSGKGGDVSKEASETISPIQYDTDYTPGAANNGTLYIQSTAFNAPDLGSSTHAQEVAVSTYAQMPSAIATTFTIDGESTPLRAIYYGTVIENMDLTTVEMTRTGYTFNGYKVKGTSTQVFDASGTFVYPITTIPSSTNPSLNMSLNAPGDIILEADWIPNTYTVTFDKQSGSGGDNTVTATYDSAMPSATAPTKSGYIFRGYYTEANGGGTKYYNADMTSAHIWDIADDNQTLYALWVVPTFTITLNADGGSGGTTSVTVTFGSDMPSATAPTKANYTFMGYFTDHDGAGTQYYYPDMSSKRVWDDDTGLINTLYAYWADCNTDKTIKVSYDSNGGYGIMEPQLVRLADNIKANIFIKGDATTHKQNYFSGWNTKADGTGRGYQPGDVIFATEEYSEITLYAQWDPTFNDIYVIATADDLLDFATWVNGGSTSIKAILAGDIDMSGKTWIPIGTSSNPFIGVFDGNGYTVSNLTMADNASYDYAGLFGYAKNATIQNVIAKNVTLYAKYPMGAVCGRIDSEMSHATGGFLTRCGSFGTFNYNYRPTTPSYGQAGGLATAETTNFEKGEISHIYSTNTAVEYVIGYFTSNASKRIPEKFNYKSSQASCTNGYLCYLLNESVSGSTSWTQTFGVDLCPRPTNRGRAVYKEEVGNTTRYYNIYNVYFISNGGTSVACSDTEVKRYSDGSNNGLSLPTTTREGYTFQGWYTEMEGGIPVSEALSSISADLILYAHWTINDYTLTYDVNGGNALSTDHKEVTYNTAYGELPTPTRTGYTFGGWYTQAIGGDAVSSETIMGAADVTIYAHWTANTYTVTLDKQSGSGGDDSVTATYDSAMPSAEAPTRTGYTFGGYYSEASGGGTKYYNADMSSAHIWDVADNGTLYALWTANSYTVTLDANGGTGGTASVSATYDSAMPSATAPTKTGYNFLGYYYNYTQYYDESMNSIQTWDRTSATTLQAHWAVKQCTVILDADAVVTTPGTASVDNVTYDQPMPTPEDLTAPTKTGYTFGGYYTGHNGSGTQYYTASMTSATNWLEDTESETTLYAKWTANQYTVSFNARGGSPSPGDITVTYDAEYGTLSTPTRYGFTFDGWYTGETDGTQVESSTIVQITDNQTLYAHWNTTTIDIEAYSAETALGFNYFRTFYDSQVAYILPSGVTAYKGQIDGEHFVLTKIDVKDEENNNVIPMDVAVILRMNPNEAVGTPIPGDPYNIKTKLITLTTSEYATEFDNTNNELIGSDVVIAEALANSYILSYGSKGLGFYEWATHELEAHKAYVIKSPSNPAKALIFRFEDDVTGFNRDGITNIPSDDSEVIIHNLNGIRLSKPQKGVNIINGRKVWVK